MTKREIRWEPGHDCIRFECHFGKPVCRPGAGASHGVHGLQIRWILIGDIGAIYFVLFTHWLPEPQEHDYTKIMPPMPRELGYHSPSPNYEDQPKHKCDVLPSGECYSDSSCLNAYEPFRVLCNEGIDALWAYLEAYYECQFHGGEFPKPVPYKYASR